MPDPSTILIADDDDEYRTLIAKGLEKVGYRTLKAIDGKAAIDLMQTVHIDCIVTDLQMPKADGIAVLRAARAHTPPLPTVIVTAYGTVESAVEAMHLGAIDYAIKPVDLDDLHTCVLQALERGRMFGEADGEEGFGGLLGVSEAMLDVYDQIRRVAPFKSTVLVDGESGTGKELVTRAIHNLSPYRDGPFVAVNCSAMPRDLVESQLFGHEKGAFTGAVAAQEGIFEAADGGTLFLDEIGELPLEAQSKLLRVLEDRQVVRLGSNKPLEINVRLLAATNVDLQQAAQAGRFRLDLYYRLNVLGISLPPLRQRREDIPLLVRTFLDRFAQENGVSPRDVAPAVLEALQAHDWPGNVRELKNISERLAVMAKDETVQVTDLSPEYRQHIPAAEGDGVEGTVLPDTSVLEGLSLEEIERAVILRTLEQTEGNRTRAAELLGISLRTMQRKLKEYEGENRQA